MECKLRALTGALLFSTLLGCTALARAQGAGQKPQAAKGDKAQVEQRGPRQGESAVDQEQEALRAPSTVDREMENLDREMARQLSWTRQAVLREAMERVREGTSHQWRWVLEGIGAFLIFLTVVGSLLWILRTLLGDWRWRRIARVQSEIHTKLLEKFASSQELLAYMETEAGRRFLESTPFEVEAKPSAAFPYGRILWSVQVGLVLATTGGGLILLRTSVPDAAQPLLVFGTLALALGLGFVFSAGVSYALSRSFGLLERPKAPLRESGPTASRG